MNENYIVINGKKAELTKEQIEQLGIVIAKDNPFNRVNGEKYYKITGEGWVDSAIDHINNSQMTKICHSVGNYCRDESLMKQRALHETLDRLLWRFACENGELDNEWNCMNEHWSIYYDHDRRDFDVDFGCYVQHQTSIYFPTKELAKKAIKEIIKPFMEEHPDFVW